MPNEFKCFRKIFPRFYALAVSEILANPRLIEKSFAWKFIFINLLPALEHHSSQQNEKWVGLFAKYSQILVFIESAVLSIIFQIVGFEGISLFQKANNHLRRVSDVTNLLGGNWSHATNFLDISFKTFLKRMNWVNCWIEVWIIVFFCASDWFLMAFQSILWTFERCLERHEVLLPVVLICFPQLLTKHSAKTGNIFE